MASRPAMDNATVLALGERAAVLLDELAGFSADETKLTRLFLSPEHRQAADCVATWMAQAGLAVHEDALGTIHGVLAATATVGATRGALLIGSHIDTVVDAGRYDGTLGVVAGLLALEEIQARGLKLPFAIRLLAFGDEEGVRFPTTLSSSAALAGCLNPENLDVSDVDGVLLRNALSAFGGNADHASSVALSSNDVSAYLEVHIEQGPVLDDKCLPLGVVTSIAGSSRFGVTVRGMAGHAGTVPMPRRRDALCTAAEVIQMIEGVGCAGSQADSLVATVGALQVLPGAVNVIPGEVRFTLDVRAATDSAREAAVDDIRRLAEEIALRRKCDIELEAFHHSDNRPCAPWLQESASRVLHEMGLPSVKLMSGAGHDGLSMASLCDIGMLFVRCDKGISHNPLESVTVQDMGFAVEALIRWIEDIARSMAAGDGAAPDTTSVIGKDT